MYCLIDSSIFYADYDDIYLLQLYIFISAILVIYLTSSLHMSKDDATAVYHAFNMLCYFSPIFGAIIADSYWGKYK